MDEVIRLDSNQGTYDTTGNKSIVDIDIPSGMGVLDLSRSYVSVRVICNAGVLKDAAGTGDAAAGAVLKLKMRHYIRKIVGNWKTLGK